MRTSSAAGPYARGWRAERTFAAGVSALPKRPRSPEAARDLYQF